MIPLKLQIKNFLSYGPEIQTIDFSPYHLICLSGKNGHGKSALLDAITWALWGQARKISGSIKADLGLLRLGQTQMLVSIDFVCNGQAYRVRREFAKTYGKPLATLDFGLLNLEDDTVVPLTAKTIKETQIKIEQTLNLDFESFINSAFLRQGQANEFSKKTPKERKEVLATILGLNRYDAVRKLATEKIRNAMAQKNSVLTLQLAYEHELQKTASVIMAINELQQNLDAVLKQEQEAGKQREIIQAELATLIDEQRKFQLLSYQLKQLEQQEKEHQENLHELFAQWRTIHKKLLQGQNREHLEDERKKLSTAVDDHQQKLQKNLELKEQIIHTKETLQRLEKQLHETFITHVHAKQISIERLSIEKNTLDKKSVELKKTLETYEKEKVALKKECTLLQSTSIQLEALQKKVVNEEQQFEKRKEHYQQFISQGNWTKKELENLDQKNALVHDTENPSCPLCEQNLSLARKRFLKNVFEKQEQFLNHRLARLSALIKKLKDILIEQHAHLGTLKKQLEEQIKRITRIDEITKALEKLTVTITAATKELHELTQVQAAVEKTTITEHHELATLQKQAENNLATDTAYQALRATIVQLEQQLQATLYNAAKHTETRTQLVKIEQQLAELTTLLEQESLQKQRKSSITTLCTRLKLIKKEKLDFQPALAPFQNLSMREAGTKKKLDDSMVVLRELQKHKETLLQEKGSLENQKAKLAQLEQEYLAQKKVTVTLDDSIKDYESIATATGKDGIQALLIEDVIPEIEQEANILLAKLTENQSHIIIESLRDLKSGGTKETLDIKISDAVGIRAYELFSGGEAFRIDFALRIAISKLLARRAGTALQTLIIDEGFGSQDDEGLSNIMDVIHKIQDDFHKIIIVSHLSTLKDQFPVHFFVEKSPSGSNIQVIEQD